MGRIGFWEILLVLAVVLIFFGPKRLPGLGNALGSAIRGFKRGFSGTDEDKADGNSAAAATTCPACKQEIPKALAAGERCGRCGYTLPPVQAKQTSA